MHELDAKRDELLVVLRLVGAQKLVQWYAEVLSAFVEAANQTVAAFADVLQPVVDVLRAVTAHLDQLWLDCSHAVDAGR